MHERSREERLSVSLDAFVGMSLAWTIFIILPDHIGYAAVKVKKPF
jgi:hypothetical protein